MTRSLMKNELSMFELSEMYYTVEPVCYEHPLVPVIWVVNDSWS